MKKPWDKDACFTAGSIEEGTVIRRGWSRVAAAAESISTLAASAKHVEIQ